MRRRVFLKACALTACSLTVSSCDQLKIHSGGLSDGQLRPNIVFIFADDMGYGDIQRYNPKSKIPTPNLNSLVDSGMQFTDAHTSSAVCTPSRYSLLTGRYCWRTRLKRGVLFPPADKPLIAKDRLTVAGMLKQQGYHTACFGKWHLGLEWARDENGKVDFNGPISYGPTDVGFDEFFGIAASLDMVPYAFIRGNRVTEQMTETQPKIGFPKYVRKGPKASNFDPGKVLDELTDEAVGYIEKRSGQDDPFFLYMPLTAPHKPVWPADRFKGKTSVGPYGDFVNQVDSSVGRVIDAINDAGIADDTIVFYSSDNGSYMYRLKVGAKDHVQDETLQSYDPTNHTANGVLRGTKTDIWEAGHRVPLIVSWPGKIKRKSQCAETVCLTDFFATCADITGFSTPDTAAPDSFSMAELINGKARKSPRPPVIHHSVNGTFAIREGKWKLVCSDGSGGRQKPVGKPFRKPYYLFDIEADISETTNIIDKHPDIARELEAKLKKIMASE